MKSAKFTDSDYPRHIFIDESGDPQIDVHKKGVSDYYVMTAIIVPSDKYKEYNSLAASIIREHFGTAEMKSSRVGNKASRRMKIIKAIARIPFKHYSQVIDKAEILTDKGLSFSRSFVKFVHRSIYQQLCRTFSKLTVIADEYGTSEFMKEFGKYLEKRLPRDLFRNSSFNYGNSKDYPFIQIGDMISGTLGRVYSRKDPISILSPILKNTVMIDEWPPKSPTVESESNDELAIKYDKIVRNQAVNQAKLFIDKFTNSEDYYEKAQIAAVRYLLFHFRSIDPREYIPTTALHHHLKELGYVMSERVLRAKVIGKLRDRSVFIVSSAKGIKIAVDVSDLIRFVAQVDNRIMPYLNRLIIIRNHFLLVSSRELDIANRNYVPALHKILETGYVKEEN
ncbi:MAG: DUF3800 domain-containing protein [bacterium]